MKAVRPRGFTLIELLTVIAIISILAAMTAVVAPRIIERARIVSLMNVCKQISTACVAYATKNANNTKTTFPAAYGYRIKGAAEGAPDDQRFNLMPYMAHLEYYGVYNMYDYYGQNSYDTDHDGKLSVLEFSPIATKQLETLVWPTTLYNGTNLPDQVSRQMTAQRPLVYLPVNSEQFTKAQTYWKYRVAATPGRLLEGAYALHWLPNETFSGLPGGKNDNTIATLNGKFPPTKYDDFVLISVGPGLGTGGILTAPDSFMNDLQSVQYGDRYYVLALRAFFLATRDMDINVESPVPNNTDGNGKFDFDFRNRTRGGGDGKPGSYADPKMYLLPDGTGGQGPIIYQCNNPGGA